MNSNLKLKTIIICSTFGLALSCFGPNSKVSADDLYHVDCGNDYEVSYITDDGHFTKHACYASFDEANQKMKEMGSEYVVRQKNSPSPTKIVSMLSGKAYTYPARNKDSNGSTLNIYQLVEHNDIEYKQTYVANHYELDYYRTERYFPNSGVGMAEVSINGFEGFTDLEYIDLVPDKFIDKGLAIYLGGGDTTSHNEQPFNVIIRRNYFKVEENNGINELIFVFHRSYCKPENTNKYDEEHYIVLGPASKEMNVGAIYYSPNGYEFYNKSDYSDEPITYYPYYQFLPIRSKTNLSAEQIDNAFLKIKGDVNSKLKGNANIFIDAQNTYGVNALLLYAMAAHESGWGTSNYALERNNLFGWNAVDADPNQASKFESVSQCVYEQAGYNLRKYADIFSPLFFSSSLGNKGSGFNVKYASDPYWGMKIASTAYKIDKLANNNSIQDYDQYDLALVNKFDAQFKQSPSEDAGTLFTAKYSEKYQENLIVIKLEDDGDFVKVQSTNPIIDGVVKKTYPTEENKGLVPYDYSQSVVYLNRNDIISLNYDGINLPEPIGQYQHSISSFDWDGEDLYIAGQAYTEQVKVDENNSIENKLIIFNENEKQEFVLDSTVDENGTVDFKGSVSLDKLDMGQYQLKVVTTYSNREDANNEFIIKNVALPEHRIINEIKYLFTVNEGNIELNISEIEAVKESKYMIVDESTLNDDGLWAIKGRAFLSGHNYDSIENVKHELLVIDQLTGEIINEYSLNTFEIPQFSLNDDYNYNFIGFEGMIPLNEFQNGHYRFQIRVTLLENENDVVSQINFESANLSYAFNYIDLENSDGIKRTIKLTTNQIYSSRFELDIDNFTFDYSKINKPSYRESFNSFNKMTLENTSLIINGYGFIYYTNCGQINNPLYNVYLVDQNGNIIDLNAIQPDKQDDRSQFYSKSRDLSRISYEVKYDLTDLDVGTYDIIVQMSTNEDDHLYYDIVQMKDYSQNNSERIVIGNKEFKIVTLNDRQRLQLEVSDSENN